MNPGLEADPAIVNRDAYGEGWMITLRVSSDADVAALMDAAAYTAHLGGK